MFYKNIKVKKNELAIVYKDQEIDQILNAGEHSIWDFGDKITFTLINLEKPVVHEKTADYLKNFCPEIVAKHCIAIETDEHEICLRYEDQKLAEVILPSKRALFWKSYFEQDFVKVPLINGYEIPEEVALKLYQEKIAKTNVIGLAQLTIEQFKHEDVGLLFVDHQIKAIIAAGRTVGYCAFKHEIQLSKKMVKDSLIHDLVADAIREILPHEITRFCIDMEVGADEAGLRYEDDMLVEILPPGTKRLYWKNNRKQHMVRVDLTEGYTLSDKIIKQLLQPALRDKGVVGDKAVLIAQIPAYHVGVLKVDGKVENLLEAGITAYWRFNREISVEIVDIRLQAVEVTGQEILTKDKVNLRVNLVANWQYTDVLTAYEKLARPTEHLYRELQFGLREAVGTRTLDELLENKDVIDVVVSEHVSKKMVGFGIETASLGVKDIILPGDMKDILAQVVEAEKSAQANVIRRREETAATRSLLNTAKVMENNPVALRLKEMETLERIAERIDKISVVGGLDQVLHGLVNIKNIEVKQ